MDKPPAPANSQLGRAQQALATAQHEVELATEEAAADAQPNLERALEDTVELIDEGQGKILKAVSDDEADAEESGAADAARAAWFPPRPAI